jgi:hypothetical protein
MVAVNSCSTYKSCPHRKRKLQKVKVVIDEGCLSILCFGPYQVDVHECR